LNCGWHVIPEGQSDKAVFWNEQTDETAFDEYDELRKNMTEPQGKRPEITPMEGDVSNVAG